MSRWSLLFLGAFLALPTTSALAQDASAAPPAAASPTDASAKKVWTNDDVTGLRESAAISTSAAASAKAAYPRPAAGIPKNRGAKWYHDQIAKLQSQLPPLNSQIADLQDALNGKPTGDGKTSQRPRGVKADDWSVELAQFQETRDGILSKIGALQDEARHNGIPASALP